MCASPEPRVRLFPATGWAAMQRHEETFFAARCVLVLADPDGSGKVAREAARELLAHWRQQDPSSIRRLLRDGESHGYWTAGTIADGTDYLFLTSLPRLMVKLDVERERAARLVTLESIRTVKGLRSELYAAVHELPGHSGNFHKAPLSRAVKAELTGVSRATQKRYDSTSTLLVQTVIAKVVTDEPVLRVGSGFFIGKGGRQLRRLPDLRVPLNQWSSSRSAARNASAKASALRATHMGGGAGVEPVSKSRGQSDSLPPPASYAPNSKSFFSGRTREDAFDAARKHRHEHRGPVTLSWGIPGSLRFEILERVR